jgi:hypothetical protein
MKLSELGSGGGTVALCERCGEKIAVANDLDRAGDVDRRRHLVMVVDAIIVDDIAAVPVEQHEYLPMRRGQRATAPVVLSSIAETGGGAQDLGATFSASDLACEVYRAMERCQKAKPE